MNNAILNTFVLVSEDRVISPVLTTTREYGNWMEKVFDHSICDMELYLKSKKVAGDRVLEKHPGTRIGTYFDKLNSPQVEYKSWFIQDGSKIIDKLVALKLCEKKDTIPISVNDPEGKRMLRVYTVSQVDLYIKTKIDRKFSITEYLGVPKQVKVDSMNYITCPKVQAGRKKLF